MSQTFTVHGPGSIISTGPIYPPIRLSSKYQHSLGLVSLNTCNTVRNIYAGQNKFYLSDNDVITIPSGTYEIDELNSYIQAEIDRNKRGRKKQTLDADSIFKLKPNNNTVRSEIQSIYAVDFTKPDNIGSMLGFTSKILEANKKHSSDKDVDIIKASNVFVDTNITSGAYRNNIPCHSIYEFGLSVGPGYTLEKVASPIIYFPITVSEFDNITIRFVDNEDKLIPFSPETSHNVRLHLKSEKWG